MAYSGQAGIRIDLEFDNNYNYYLDLNHHCQAWTKDGEETCQVNLQVGSRYRSFHLLCKIL